MKRRIRRVVNFFAFNLLFFALYLNFIHKDNSSAIGGQAIPSANETVVVKKQESAAIKPAAVISVSANVADK